MATPLMLLIRYAHEAGVEITRRPDYTLKILTPDSADSIARAVRSRDQDVLKLYDWSHAGVGDPMPCLLCERSALLRDPVEGRPCHRVCCDAILRPEGTTP